MRRSIEEHTEGPESAFLWRSDTVSFGAVKRNGVGKNCFPKATAFGGFLREQKVTRRRPWQGLIELQGPRPRLDVGPGKGASRDFSLIPLFSEKGGIFQKIIDNSSFGWYTIKAALNGNEKRDDRHTGELGAKRAL